MRRSIGLDRIVIGLLVAALGVMLLLDTTNFLVTEREIFGTYWPSLLIVWGAWGIISNGFRFSLGSTAILLVGVGFQLAQLGLWNWNVGQLWPVVIVVLGLFLVFSRPQRRWRRPHHRNRREPGNGGAPSDSGPTPSNGSYRHDSPGDRIRAAHVLGGGKERIASQDFQGGEVSAVFGGMELDLREAGLAEGRATLEATIICGGLKLRVPREWRVSLQTSTLFGGADNRHQQPPPEQSHGELTIVGTIICGGIEVQD